MGLFSRKPKEVTPTVTGWNPLFPKFNPSNWSKDMEVLHNTIGHHTEPIIKYQIDSFSNNMSNNDDKILDDDAIRIVSSAVESIVKLSSPLYLEYLGTAYYSGYDGVIAYIATLVYNAIIDKCVNKNVERVTARLRKQHIERVAKMNAKHNKK